MSRIAATFSSLREGDSIAYIPYVCAGDPDSQFTHDLVRTLCDSGADIIELGLPFSDPVADGPMIQAAMGRSLSNGFRPRHVPEMIASLRESGVNQPIVVMSYSNPIAKIGNGEFCRLVAQAGGDGILPVDLPIEESAELDRAAEEHGLDVIRLIAPTTPDGRLRRIADGASGFIYAVSVAGVTGARDELPESAALLLKRAVKMCELPVVLGFGISRPAHVSSAMALGSSGVVEGSALIEKYSPTLKDRRKSLETVAQHALQMKKATRRKL